MIRICRRNPDYGEYDEPEWLAINFFPWSPISHLKYKIINRLDKDAKHAIICKITKRHRSPHLPANPDAPISLFDTSWNCVRCGEKVELNLLIPTGIIEGTNPWSDWKEYARIVNIPNIKIMPVEEKK